MSIVWSEYSENITAFKDPYFLVINYSSGYWHYNCFVLEQGGQETWIGGSDFPNDLSNLKAAKKAAIKIMKDHQKSSK